MSEKDGGPAFPVQSLESEYRDERYHDVWRPVGGMSLRDYFAGQALMGFAASMNSEARRRYLDAQADGREACVAYRLADAMLEQRGQS